MDEDGIDFDKSRSSSRKDGDGDVGADQGEGFRVPRGKMRSQNVFKAQLGWHGLRPAGVYPLGSVFSHCTFHCFGSAAQAQEISGDREGDCSVDLPLSLSPSLSPRERERISIPPCLV